jgi:predicted ester cyclase
MPEIVEVAAAFFEACETGKGWEGCQDYCTPDASFSSQAEPLADISKLADYTEWMKGLLIPIADGHYELKSFAVDHDRNSVCAYAVFKGTHTGEGGPVPATGKTVAGDYVYVMEFEGAKIRNMIKVWHAGWSLNQLGWT